MKNAEVALLCGAPHGGCCDYCGKDGGIRITVPDDIRSRYYCANCLAHRTENYSDMERMLEDLLHQLSTDSDLEDKVSRPDKYQALTADLRELVERVTGRRTTC